MASGSADQISPGTSTPEIARAASPATTATTNWIMATTPMPRSLPASSWSARTRTSSSSTTALDFSSTTPTST